MKTRHTNTLGSCIVSEWKLFIIHAERLVDNASRSRFSHSLFFFLPHFSDDIIIFTLHGNQIITSVVSVEPRAPTQKTIPLSAAPLLIHLKSINLPQHSPRHIFRLIYLLLRWVFSNHFSDNVFRIILEWWRRKGGLDGFGGREDWRMENLTFNPNERRKNSRESCKWKSFFLYHEKLQTQGKISITWRVAHFSRLTRLITRFSTLFTVTASTLGSWCREMKS